MELKIKQMSFPEAIEFNFNELKQELTKKVEHYKGLVYTDDQVHEAKKDVAALRKFTKALSDERIKVKKECLKPYEEFESKIKELSAIVNEPISLIDNQVKEYEEQKKQDKMDSINAYWNECEHPEGLSLEEIFDKKWLNASTSMNKVKKEITEAIQKFSKDMATLATLPEYSFEAQQTYISTLDLAKAINEANRLSEMAKKKAEAEAKAAEAKAEAEQEAIHPASEGFMNPPVEETEQTEESFIPSFDEVAKASWVSFKAEMTQKQVDELIHFFEFRDIPFTLL